MSDRRENSLLFSLNELKGLEEERQAEEAAVVRAREEAQRSAREAEERRKREEEEAKVRAAEEKIRLEREEKERLAREERLRIEESERRAHVEAEARIEEARLIKETQERIKKALPYKLLAAVGGLILLVAAIVIGVVINKRIEDQKADQAKLDVIRKAEKAADDKRQAEIEEQERDTQRKIKELQSRLTTTTSEVEKKKLEDSERKTKSNSGGSRNTGKKPSSGGKIDSGDSGSSKKKDDDDSIL